MRRALLLLARVAGLAFMVVGCAQLALLVAACGHTSAVGQPAGNAWAPLVRESVVTRAAGAAMPALSGKWIVWMDRRSGNWDIFARSLIGGKERPVAVDSADNVQPSVDGNYVVWTSGWRDGSAMGPIIRGLDLKSGAQRAFGTSSTRQSYPSVSRGIVTWAERNGSFAPTQIVGTHIAKRDNSVVSAPADAAMPWLDGTHAVFMVDAAPLLDPSINWDIFFVDLARLKPTGSGAFAAEEWRHVRMAPGGQVLPNISGDIVVWTDVGPDHGNIYGCKVGDWKPFIVCAASGEQTWSRVSGDLVVWQDRRAATGTFTATHSAVTRSSPYAWPPVTRPSRPSTDIGPRGWTRETEAQFVW